ncbi:MAG: pyruvate kinase [Bacteroidia bacterium]|nr:pyruvate kinase [Bacteroidia bacterium]
MKLEKIEKELEIILKQLLMSEKKSAFLFQEVHKKYKHSSKNLFRYLVLRSFDLRKVQDALSDLGISSLRTAEVYVLDNLLNTLKLVKLLQNKAWNPDAGLSRIGFSQSQKLLRKHANTLFGTKEKKHSTHIMVTMPTEASENIDLLRKLVQEGMEIARINLSHDDIPVWEKMVANLKQVREEMQRPLQIYMDLSGPKIRTGEIWVPKNKKAGEFRNFIRLKSGDHLWLTTEKTQAKKAVYGERGELISPAEISVSLPQIITDVKLGDPLFFDDGKIEAQVIEKGKSRVKVLIIQAHKSKLGSEKGINLPSTKLNLPSLTKRDIELLPFIKEQADIVGYSFVRNEEDVAKLFHELDKLENEDLGVVFKIETRDAFDNLPLILFKAMKRRKIGVMIARGDLAVEIGYERISEVQNEILWFCEAAHIPVIWATQVLENLAKKGIATRAEVSDVSISVQAECVMLNKGPHIVQAVKTLNNILVKMDTHTSKKKSRMRPLIVAKINLDKINGLTKQVLPPSTQKEQLPPEVSTIE